MTKYVDIIYLLEYSRIKVHVFFRGSVNVQMMQQYADVHTQTDKSICVYLCAHTYVSFHTSSGRIYPARVCMRYHLIVAINIFVASPSSIM